MKKYNNFINEYHHEYEKHDYVKYDEILNIFLNKHNLSINLYDDADNLKIYQGKKEIGLLRYYIENEIVVIENIELKSEYIGKNIGFVIYESLYFMAKESDFGGLYSELSTLYGFVRKPAATKVLFRLINKYGGAIYDESDYIEDDEIHGEKYSFYIDGRGHIDESKV